LYFTKQSIIKAAIREIRTNSSTLKLDICFISKLVTVEDILKKKGPKISPKEKESIFSSPISEYITLRPLSSNDENNVQIDMKYFFFLTSNNTKAKSLAIFAL
jgi:hypothetical protein